jgi:hypothetical protein
MKTVLLILLIGFVGCTSRTEKFSMRQNAIDYIQDLKSVNQMILKNIIRLQDSCCQNLGQSCNNPDSIKKNIFYPATYALLDKYLPNDEKSALKILEKLSPSRMRNSSDNVIISDLRFRPDSTIIYPVADYSIGDTIINHRIVYSPIDKYNPVPDSVYTVTTILPNWKYYILWHIDQGW